MHDSEDSDDSVRWKEELARSPSPEVENDKDGFSSVVSMDEGEKAGKDPAETNEAPDANLDQILESSSDEDEEAEKAKRLGEWVGNAQIEGGQNTIARPCC